MSEYPVEIDLGRLEPDMPVSPANAPSGGKKGKNRKFYPTLYIDNIEGMPALPKEGCVMIKFRRKRMSVDENMDGKETTGMTLEVRKICLPEDMADDADDDIGSAMQKYAKGKGVDTGREESDEETDDEDDEE